LPISFTIFARTGFTLLNRVPYGKFNRVKMKISHKLFKIHIPLANDGFITILKKRTVSAVTAVK
jgi:hypothetical protein